MASLLSAAYQTAIESHARGELLDLGCGAAPLYGVYGSLSTKVTCVDWQSSLHGSQHVDIAMDLNEPLKLADEQFDTVLMTDVLEHIGEPITLVREIHRVLRRGGTLIGGVPFLYWLHETPFDYYRYTRFALESFFVRTGFRDFAIQEVGGLPDVLLDLTAKGVVCLGPLQRPLVRFFELLLKAPGVGYLRNRTLQYFPLAYVFVAVK